MEDRLTVGSGREPVAAGLELGSQRPVVVDLRVGDEGHRAVLGIERLVAARDVDDRQAGVGQRDRADAPDGVSVGPTVPQRFDHPLGGVGGGWASRIENRSDPAHSPPSWQAGPLSQLCHTQVWSRAPPGLSIDPSTTDREVDRCTA